MIDEIFDRDGKDVTLKEVFVNVMGENEGGRVLGQVLKENKAWREDMGRLQVWEAGHHITFG